MRRTLRQRLRGLLFTTAMKVVRNKQEHRRSQFAALGGPPGGVVFLGDSISEEGLWDEWFPAIRAINRGIGGETSAQVLARLDTAVDRPAAVFLLIGTNDLSAGVQVDEIARNIDRIVERISERAPGAPVFVQSVLPRNAKFTADLRRLNQRLRAIPATKSTARFVDLWPALAAADGTLRREFSLDWLHLNGEGYRTWAEAIRPLIRELDSPSGSGLSQMLMDE